MNIEKLKEEKRKLEEKLENIKQTLEDTNFKIASCYSNFFEEKTNKEFELITKWPTKEEFRYFADGNYGYEKANYKPFPLYKEAIFDVAEVAEVIKLAYQFERQQEYDILTIGGTKDKDVMWGWVHEFKTVPYLFFFIGNKKTLEPYYEFKDKFCDIKIYYKYVKELGAKLSTPQKDFIVIPLESPSKKDSMSFYFSSSIYGNFDMECLVQDQMDIPNQINYMEKDGKYTKDKHCSFLVDRNFNIFKNIMVQMSYEDIQDILSFGLAKEDKFLADLLLSICIYKKNNKKTILTSEDYKYIFKTVYKEEVDINSLIEKDITRKLEYVRKI